MHVCRLIATVAGSFAVASAASAVPVYTNDFETDTTAAWTVNLGATDGVADFYYDAATNIGVPASVSGSNRVLKLTANNADGVLGGISVSPNGQSFTGSYRLSFDLWQNYVGPVGPGGNGTTQLSTFGVGTAGTSANYPGVADSVWFGATLDGGSASDYRAYSPSTPTSYGSGNAVYVNAGNTTGGINNSSTYFATNFAPQPAPASQTALFAGQTGSTDAGEISFTWRKVTIDVDGGFATWSVDGLEFAKVDLSTETLGGSNIFFGHSDTNSGVSADANRVALNVTLIDNVVVDVVPEPATLSALAAGGLVLMRRRRR